MEEWKGGEGGAGPMMYTMLQLLNLTPKESGSSSPRPMDEKKKEEDFAGERGNPAGSRRPDRRTVALLPRQNRRVVVHTFVYV